MRTRSRQFLMVPLALLALGCSKPRFVYTSDPDFSLSTSRTMAADPRRDLMIIREGMRPIEPGHLRAAVVAELKQKNFQAAPAAVADLWVAVFVLDAAPGRSGSSAKGSGRGGAGTDRGVGGYTDASGQRSGGRSEVETSGSSLGSLTVIVQVQDRKSARTVWQGEATVSPSDKGPDGRPVTDAELVSQLLKPIPPRP